MSRRTQLALVAVLALAAPARAAGPVYPKNGCNSVTDPTGDAVFAPAGLNQPEPSLDITGVVMGTTPTALVGYVRVAHLASRPVYAPGYTWFLTFLYNGKAFSAISTVYDPDSLGAPQDALSSATGKKRQRLEVANTPVQSGLTVTYDTARSLVVFTIPLADLYANAGKPAKRGTVLSSLVARDTDTYPGAGSQVNVDTTDSGKSWAWADNRCFPKR